MKKFAKNRTIKQVCLLGLMSLSTQAMASGFQLLDQDAVSLGTNHAGYAALANDASIGFYNPAGMMRIKNQQLILAALGVMTDVKFTGDTTVNTIDAGNTQFPVTAQGGNFSLIPALHYVAPLSDWASFGFSINLPFGLKNNYGNGTMLRYTSTRSSATVIDITPSLAFQPTEKGSIGFGFDIQRMYGEFDQVGTLGPGLDTPSTNQADGTGYGYHLGGLYELTPTARIGISYHSQVVHHLSGSSKFVGPLANLMNNGPIVSNRATVNVTLPPYTALSGYYLINPKVAVMGSFIYTQWTTLQNLILNHIAGVDLMGPTTDIQIIIPQKFHNTWNFSLGADYYVTDQITLRGGLGYDQTPVRNAYRNVQLPDNDRYSVALGGHYQASKTVGLDIGWSHIFIERANLNPPPQALGSQVVTTNGSVTGGGDVLGGQITWDFV